MLLNIICYHVNGHESCIGAHIINPNIIYATGDDGIKGSLGLIIAALTTIVSIINDDLAITRQVCYYIYQSQIIQLFW